MNKFVTSAVALIAFASASAGACENGGCSPPQPTCGQTGCSSVHGRMDVYVSSVSKAFGDEALAGSGGSYNFTSKIIGTNALGGVDYINLNGGFNAVTEGSGQATAGGMSYGEAQWSNIIRW